MAEFKLKYNSDDLAKISKMFASLTDNYNNCNQEGLAKNLEELLLSEYPVTVLEQYVLSINALSKDNMEITEDSIMAAATYILMRMNFCS